MKKLLVVCGPTATGKTSLAIALAKKFGGEIVSADSRQVYTGMDIGTGKEWGDAVIHGYDLVDPKSEFSVSKYLKFAREVLSEIWRRGKLPILVGGTGFYIKGVVDGIPTATVPRNEKLRGRLEEKEVDELYEHLSQLDALRAGGLNASDRRNPRRLIRAIEIAQYMINHKALVMAPVERLETLFVGLGASRESIEKKINSRVDDRLVRGVKKEIEKLMKKGVDWHHQSMMALGYRQWRDFFEGGVPEEVVVAEWKREEVKYARRQMTWFKKDKRINWFDIGDPGYPENVENLVKKWYIKGYAEKS